MRSTKERRLKQVENINPDVKKHYTPLEIVKYCLSFLDLREMRVLDVGSGENMVWYNNLICREKDWVEIDKGKDFFDYNDKVDWCIGNPPFRVLWDIIKKSTELSDKGFAYLVAIDGINRLTPKRLQFLKDKGFYLNKIVVMNISLWWGRYFFIIFKKEKNDFVGWRNK